MPSSPNNPAPVTLTWGVVTVVLTLLGWSSVPLFLRHFAESIDAWTSNGWRYGFAALLWAPAFALAMRRADTRGRLLRMALIPSVFNAAGQVCFTWAHYMIDPGLLTFALRFQIVFVAVGAFAMFPSERAVVRAPLYIVGFALVLLGGTGAGLLGDEPLRGANAAGFMLAVLSGALFAAYALSVRKCMHGTHPITAFAAISVYTAGVMLLLMLAFGRRAGLDAIDLPGEQFALLVLSALIGIALGHVFYYISIARLGVAVASGVIQLQPFVVGVGSFFLFNEALHARQWASGCAAVMGALLMLETQRRISGAAKRARLVAPPIDPTRDDDALEAVAAEGAAAPDIIGSPAEAERG